MTNESKNSDRYFNNFFIFISPFQLAASGTLFSTGLHLSDSFIIHIMNTKKIILRILSRQIPEKYP